MTEDQAYAKALRRIEKARKARATRLDLSDLGLKILPPEIGQLSSLQILYVGRNQLATLPDSLGQLRSLQVLNLHRNQLATLPDSLGQLSSLQKLYLHDNQLATLPDRLGQLSSLQTLTLSRNRLATLLDSLGQLSSLQKLYLRHNQLASLPDSLGQLSSLQRLFLDGNQLATLPESLLKLTSLRVLLLHHNPALKLPEEVLGAHSSDADRAAKPADILDYYFGTLKAAKPLLEGKLILVGRGAVGKTSLVKRLVDNTFDPEEKMTEGIRITEWPVKLGRGETARMNVWDFGGQEIMHSTHQFFLTERSLYLVVLNGRDGLEDEDAHYWLKMVESFGERSPAIVVLNKIKGTPFELNERDLKKTYPFIKAFVKTDCEGKRPPDIVQLRKLIRKETNALDDIRASFPASWFGIKDRLGEMAEKGENYLRPETYAEICEERGETDPEKQKQLSRFLHVLGIALNYAEDARLRHAHVLNPRWVTNGIYKILNSKTVQKNHGDLRLADAGKILPPKDYPEDMQKYLCELMRRFELWFSFPDDAEHYLIPQLLPKQTPEAAGDFDRSATLEFEYTYPVMMPEGLLPRFIVRTHSLSTGQPRWRSGVILRMWDNQALVYGHLSERRVRISVSGPEAGRERLLSVIRFDFEHVHKELSGLQVIEQLVPEAANIAIKHEELLALEAEGEKEVVRYAGGQVVRALVTEMLNRVDPKGFRHEPPERAAGKRLPELFYSYAHEDERHLNQLQKHLNVLVTDRLMSDWYDRDIPPGDDWDLTIDEHIRSADIILLIVSPSFLASKNIREKELEVALERHEAGEARVIPVILEECLWKKRAVFKGFSKLQALPKNAKAVRSWVPQRNGWYDVAEKLEGIVEDLNKELKKARRQGSRWSR